MKMNALVAVLAFTLALPVVAEDRPLQYSLRNLFLTTTCAAAVVAASVMFGFGDRKYDAYATPYEFQPRTPVPAVRAVIAPHLATAIANHGHFLSFEEAVAVAVTLEHQHTATLNAVPGWTSFIDALQSNGFLVAKGDDGVAEITRPAQLNPDRQRALFVDALVVVQMSSHWRYDPPGKRVQSVEDIFLNAMPLQGDAPYRAVRWKDAANAR